MRLGVLVGLVLLAASQGWTQPAQVNYSVWNDTAVPSLAAADDASGVEVGLKFRSAVSGFITGIRFYKGAGNTGPHVGNVWTSTGALLGSVTFASEAASGWQEQALASPVPISSNTTYVVSYHAPAGHYAVDVGYFAASGVDNAPLRALANGEDGPNGVYAYSASGNFPNQTFNAANYWVDVVVVLEDPACFADTNPPAIFGPRDVILECANCNTDPSNTGVATATDKCRVTVTYNDQVCGVCPKVVTRTWTATDRAGNMARAVQTITCLPPSLVTDGSGCIFDRNPTTPVQDFRLLFTADPHNAPCARLTASNPGQFLFNVFYTGTPGQKVSFNLTVPYPFVTQGANPIHAYDWVTVASGDYQQCLTPGNGFFASSQLVNLADYAGQLGAVRTIPVTLTIPRSGVVYLAVHLDYGLKKLSGYRKNAAADALDCDTGTQVLIPNHGRYGFSVSGAQSGSTSLQNENSFNGKAGRLGLLSPQVQTSDGSLGAPTKRFGFMMTGDSDQVVVVEACTNLTHPVWFPVATNTLTGDSGIFNDLQCTNYPTRFYRLRAP